jgi:hypothetical protein
VRVVHVIFAQLVGRWVCTVERTLSGRGGVPVDTKKGMSGWALIGSLVSSGVIMLVQSIFELRKAESAAGD